MNHGVYLLSPDCLLPLTSAPVSDPRCSMALHRVKVRVLSNDLELLRHKTQKRNRFPITNIASNPPHSRVEKTKGPPDAHLVDEVHGGREEHHDTARGLPSARAAGVFPRQHDGDHGLPGAGVEHRDGVPAKRRREHLHLVPARERTHHVSSAQAPPPRATPCERQDKSRRIDRSVPPRLELLVRTARRRELRRWRWGRRVGVLRHGGGGLHGGGGASRVRCW